MAVDDFNARMARLEALFERMVSAQQAPVVNVNVSLADLLTKKKKAEGALNSPETQTPDTPEPGGYPRPYVS